MESEVNALVDELCAERDGKKLKMLTGGMFTFDDIDTDFDVKFDTGTAVKKEEPEITYI